MHRADFELRDGVSWTRDEQLRRFLTFSNMKVLSVGPERPLRARFALFPQLTFAHVSSSPARVLWDRDVGSVDRVLALVTRLGSVDVTTDGVVLRRPGVTLVMPGISPVTVEMTSEENEVLYASLSPGLVPEIVLPTSTRRDPNPLDADLLSPLLMFMVGMCRISTASLDDAAPLRAASREIAAALLTQIIGESSRPRSLFARAMELLLANYTDPNLHVDAVADRLGVSTRSLQLAFSAESTTVSAQLRDVRVRAARRLRTGNPELTQAGIAHAVGFGSSSALYRALRDAPETTPE